jgi:hypothetical protein
MLCFQSSDFEASETSYNLLRFNIWSTIDRTWPDSSARSSGKTTLVLSKNLDWPLRSVSRMVIDSSVGFHTFLSSTSRATSSLPSNRIASGVLTSLTYSEKV